jgi:hypothetical protein
MMGLIPCLRGRFLLRISAMSDYYICLTRRRLLMKQFIRLTSRLNLKGLAALLSISIMFTLLLSSTLDASQRMVLGEEIRNAW